MTYEQLDTVDSVCLVGEFAKSEITVQTTK